MKPAPPSPTIRLSLALNRLRIEAAIQSELSHAVYLAEDSAHLKSGSSVRPDEVSVLIHFFLRLPTLQDHLNQILESKGVTVEVKGVFCHKNGNCGPVVDFDVPPGSPGCELADLLVLVTDGSPGIGDMVGNACFLQAKVERKKFNQGASAIRQSALYCHSRSFRFRNPSAYFSPDLPDHQVPGHRDMPVLGTSGFAFWSYDAFANYWHDQKKRWYGWNNASAFALPMNLNDPTKDIGFGHAIYRLMEGSLGLGVAPTSVGDFGWNRIVHDVVLRAMSEPLGKKKGIVGLDDLKRAKRDYHWLKESSLIESGVAAVMNPFRELAAAFGSKAMSQAAEAHVEKRERLAGEELEAALVKAGDSGNQPPKGDGEIGPNDSGSSGSFIQIKLTEK